MSVLGYVLVWFTFNAAVFAGMWWATRPPKDEQPFNVVDQRDAYAAWLESRIGCRDPLCASCRIKAEIQPRQ